VVINSFTYLESGITIDGGTEQDVMVRNTKLKARRAFRLVRPVWKSMKISTKTKLTNRISNNRVLRAKGRGEEIPWGTRLDQYPIPTSRPFSCMELNLR